jgi:hypothetical protein
MEKLLSDFEKYDSYSLNLGKHKIDENISSSISRFVHVLRLSKVIFEKKEILNGEGDDNINAKWLLNLCKQVPSELGLEAMARAVLDASNLSGEGNQQDALFAALGASEEALAVLFEIFPKLPHIKQNVRPSELGGGGLEVGISNDFLDEEELNRQRLLQEAMDTAEIAAITQAEAMEAATPSAFGSTHTIRRASEMREQKRAQKAAKKAAQALQRAKDAGAIIEDSELLSVNEAGVGLGGLMGRSVDEVQALQRSLLPEGSRQYHREDGLPSGTIREDDDIIGFEKVTIPPPILDSSKLHPRLQINDILDDTCARAFSGTQSLNPMQSTVYDTAFNRRENMLVCAPTGAGRFIVRVYNPLSSIISHI